MRENPRPFEIYRHFKGNQYQILTLAKDSEDGRALVVYQALYGDYTVYVRDLEQFMSSVDKVKYPDVTQTYRFEQVLAEKEEVSAQEVPMQETMAEVVSVQETTVEIASLQEPLVNEPTPEAGEDEFVLDPMVEAFLDTDSIDEKLNILAGLHHRITKEMLATMAVVSDIELNEGSVEEQYVELRDYLLMKEKFECKRTW
ncbi:MAG: DUF1653 domain-containing protein [Lachnospiraceae bacterium]|nr:DUF1653 domain-containing protein [Lachnospiraceae bacterium]